MLSSIVLVSPIQQCKSAIIIRISPPSHSHRPQVVAELRAGLPVLRSNFSPAVCSTHGSAHMSVLLSPFAPLSPHPTVSMSSFSTSASLSLPCK